MLADYFGTTQLTPTAYYLLTYLSLLAIYVFAVCIQSAYRVGGGMGWSWRLASMQGAVSLFSLQAWLAPALLYVNPRSLRPASLLLLLPHGPTHMLPSLRCASSVRVLSSLQVVGLVGATLGTTMAFIFPGMLALRDCAGGAPLRAFGCVLLAAGVMLTGVGLVSSDDG